MEESCIDDERVVVFLELVNFGVEKTDVVAFCFPVPKRVTRPDESMAVDGVNILETGFLVCVGR